MVPGVVAAAPHVGDPHLVPHAVDGQGGGGSGGEGTEHGHHSGQRFAERRLQLFPAPDQVGVQADA